MLTFKHSRTCLSGYRYVNNTVKGLLTRLGKGELVLQSPKFRQMMKINFPFPSYHQPKDQKLDKVHIKLGKKVLDNLIEGMYSDSFFIFREYIQNASDSIDDAVDAGLLKHRREGEIIIDLSLDTVIIKDNGTGIKKESLFPMWGILEQVKDSKVRKVLEE